MNRVLKNNTIFYKLEERICLTSLVETRKKHGICEQNFLFHQETQVRVNMSYLWESQWRDESNPCGSKQKEEKVQVRPTGAL